MLSISISSISDQVVSVSSRKHNALVARCGQQQARTEKSAVNDGHLHCCVKHGSLSRFDVRGTILLSTLFFRSLELLLPISPITSECRWHRLLAGLRKKKEIKFSQGKRQTLPRKSTSKSWWTTPDHFLGRAKITKSSVGRKHKSKKT